jgi:hypothetical protein
MATRSRLELNANERKTLAAVREISARKRPRIAGKATAAEVAKKTRTTENVQRARIARLRSRGLLVGGTYPVRGALGTRHVGGYSLSRDGARALG